MRVGLVIVFAFVSCTVATAIDPPPAAMKLIEAFKAKEKAAKDKLDAEIAALRAKAAHETEETKKQLIAELEKVRAALEKEEKHNEARAVAARIRSIVSPPVHAAIAPVNMTSYATNEANFDKAFIFRVTGRLEGGSVWGVGPYTSDSDLYRAVIHGGILTNGETGLVKVTLISTVGIDFAGSTQNGVTTMSYTAWTAGYRLERVTSEEAEGVIEAEDPIVPAGGETIDASSSAGSIGEAPPGASGASRFEKLAPRSRFGAKPK